MTVIAGLGGTLFLFSTVIGGARLLLLARRSRQLPEFVLGVGLFVMGGVATPLAALGRAPLDLPPGVGATCFAASLVFLTIGAAGFTLFTQRVFRPRALWARCLAVGLPGAMALGIAICALGVGFETARFHPGPGYSMFQAGILIVITWCGFESTRFANALRRRVRLGLADPVVANRVRLWGAAMIIASLMCAGTLAGQLLGVDAMGTTTGLALVGGFGSVAASAIWLAFLPPRSYTRWIAATVVGEC